MESTEDEIRQKLAALYFLDTEEIENIMQKIENLPESARREILSTLQEAKKKQDDFFEQNIRADEEFFEKLKIFLDGHVKMIEAASKFPKF